MKLRNKKTGEINLGDLHLDDFNSLAELNAEWEDYEEPKEYWFISTTGKAHRFEGEDETYTPDRKQLGNYFETKEEAELAVRKLKAWKRLKDKGFRFIDGYLDNNNDFIMKAKLGHVGLIDQPDVHLLFGGEE